MSSQRMVIFQKQWWSGKRNFLVVVLAIIALALSVIKGSRQDVGGDFHVFWLAGQNFLDGAPLYLTQEGARDFIYPPFAAMCFQIFALFPLKVSASIFFFINILLMISSIYLTAAIVNELYPQRNAAKWTLVFSILFSARFFANNMNLLQINEVVFFLCLLGLYLYLEKKDVPSTAAFVVATCLKITPIFFLAWLLLRGRKNAVVSIIPILVVCLSLPLFIRGVNAGVRDISSYYLVSRQSFQQGRVVTNYTNQNLAALIYRMTSPSPKEENTSYRYIPVSENTTRLIYRSAFALLFFVAVINLITLRAKKRPILVFEICSIFLIGHLLSGITWKAHLVTLFFVYFCYFSLNLRGKSYYVRSSVYFIWFLIGFVGMLGKDVVGRTLHYYIGGYSVVGWMLLLLFVVSVILSQSWAPEKTHQTSPSPASDRSMRKLRQ